LSLIAGRVAFPAKPLGRKTCDVEKWFRLTMILTP
jgi:hypothetical protein